MAGSGGGIGIGVGKAEELLAKRKAKEEGIPQKRFLERYQNARPATKFSAVAFFIMGSILATVIILRLLGR